MADTPNPEQPTPEPSVTPDPPATPAEPTGATEPSFSQTDLDRIVARRVAKAEKATEKRVRAELESRAQIQEAPPNPAPQAPEKQNTDDPTIKALLAQVAELTKVSEANQRKASFAEATAGHRLTAEDREALWESFNPANAEVTQKLAERLSQASAPSPEPAPQGNPAARAIAQPPPGTPGYQDPGGVSGTPRDEFETDVTKLDRDSIDRLKREGKFRERLDQYKRRGAATSPFGRPRPIRQP